MTSKHELIKLSINMIEQMIVAQFEKRGVKIFDLALNITNFDTTNKDIPLYMATVKELSSRIVDLREYMKSKDHIVIYKDHKVNYISPKSTKSAYITLVEEDLEEDFITLTHEILDEINIICINKPIKI